MYARHDVVIESAYLWLEYVNSSQFMQVRFAFLAGLAVVVLLIPLNRWLATRIEAAR